MADFDRLDTSLKTGSVSNTKVNKQLTASLGASIELTESASMYLHLLRREEAAEAIEQFVRLANLALNGLSQCRAIAQEPRDDEPAVDDWVSLETAAGLLDVSRDEVMVLYQLDRLEGVEEDRTLKIARDSVKRYRQGAYESETTDDSVPDSDEIKGVLNDLKGDADQFDDILQRLFESPQFRQNPFEEPPTRQTVGLKTPPPIPESEVHED